MSIEWGPGLHAPAGQSIDQVAYERYVGRWSRLFVPAVLAAADVGSAHRVLDVATGAGAAAELALTKVGPDGLVVATDIAPGMLGAAKVLFTNARLRPVVTDGQALAFADRSFDAVIWNRVASSERAWRC